MCCVKWLLLRINIRPAGQVSITFTHAAGALGVTQPSLTVLIQDIEHTLGLRLLERSTRSVKLTEAGEDFLARIQRPLVDIEEAYRSLMDLSAANRGTVVLGTLPSAAFGLVPAALQRMRVHHPALHARVLEAHNDELLEMLRSNQVECAIGALSSSAPDLVFEALLTDGFFVVFPAGHVLEKYASIDWQDLLPHELILLSQGSNAREKFDRALQDKDEAEPLVPRYDVTHIITAASFVRRGLGITVLPRLALPELNLQGLQVRAIRADNAQRKIGLLYRRDRILGPSTRHFIEHLRAVIPIVEAALPPLES